MVEIAIKVCVIRESFVISSLRWFISLWTYHYVELGDIDCYVRFSPQSMDRGTKGKNENVQFPPKVSKRDSSFHLELSDIRLRKTIECFDLSATAVILYCTSRVANGMQSACRSLLSLGFNSGKKCEFNTVARPIFAHFGRFHNGIMQLQRFSTTIVQLSCT